MLQDVNVLLEQFKAYPWQSDVAIDIAHDFFILGSLLSRKPHNILELGIGSGFVSQMLLAAIRTNRRGTLTSVDSLWDWKGVRPPHFDSIESGGGRIVIEEEESFLVRQDSGRYDFIISDGDHVNMYFFIDKIFRVAKKDAFIFFHDTNNPMFSNLLKIEAIVRKAGHPCYHFKDKSAEGERTDRGLLFVINSGHGKVNAPLHHKLKYKYKKFKKQRKMRRK
ncbi:MAG: class I SAM-dependent methyltransferase [Candidatus Omnitrophica bacterium]|nr:class I SAM-dependent methyltransferase [Candidatus Omnitrophota bacterium]